MTQTIVAIGLQVITLLSGVDVLRCENASTLTIAGITAGSDGQVLRIESVGSGHVKLAHEHGSASVDERLMNFVGSAPTPLAGGFGIAEYVYDAAFARWRLRTHEQGRMITEPFTASNYTAAPSGSWGVEASDQITLEYYLSANMLSVNWVIGNTNVSGLPSGLRMRIPGGFSAWRRVEPPQYWAEVVNGEEVKVMGYADVNPAIPGWIGHYKMTLEKWRTTSNHETSVHGSTLLSVQ